jgi:DNA invertase Pin-like site-specific DNA recombinase
MGRSLAEFEREIFVERTKAGLKAAKERGNIPGRKPGLTAGNQKKAAQAYKLFKDTQMFHYGTTICIFVW